MKKIVVIRNGCKEGTNHIEQTLKEDGWDLETICLEKGEPLPQSFEEIGGLLIVGEPMHVYEQETNPCLKVYLNM